MRKILLGAIATLMLASNGPAETPGPATPQTALARVGQMNNAFASDLYARLGAHDGNVIFSPASIQIALAMTVYGAGLWWAVHTRRVYQVGELASPELLAAETTEMAESLTDQG